jgi:ParB family chromosome partitioning protein
MKPQRIEMIPLSQIRIVNPRARNRHTFNGIVTNIGLVGLKRPITVFRRTKEQDGTLYDLVCGQGRLEAVAALGGREIPAIITEATLKERYLMSLVENVARKRPPQSDLLREVRTLKERGYRNTVIAEKLGLGKTYIEGILRLLRCGEDRLVERVTTGSLPLNVAIQIATTGGDDLQRALSDAYDRGELRGTKLVTAQRLVAQRSAKKRDPHAKIGPRPTRKDLVKEYELHTQRQRALIERAGIVHERLALLTMAMKKLLADSTLLEMLRAEGLDTMPEPLAVRLA